MKRLITYIRNLFGADERLRKWCLESTIKGFGPNLRICDEAVNAADKYFLWIKTGKLPRQSST